MPLTSTNEENFGGSKAGLNMTACQSPAITETALAHLHSKAQPSGPKPKRTGKDVVTSLGMKRSS